MKKIMKIFVPILVLALLIQLPLSASASTLSEASKLEFDVMAAPAGAPANTQVKLYLTTTSAEAITTVGATLVLKNFDNNFALYNGVDNDDDDVFDSYVDASANYKVVKTELGKAFPIEAADIDGDAFIDFPAASLASYNETSGEMYLFIAAWNDGIVIPAGEKTEVATFYIQAKDGVTPSNDNMRLMKNNEFKNPDFCLCNAIYPTAISSSDIVLQPSVDDIIAENDFTIDFPQPAPAAGTITGTFTCNANNTSTVTISLMNGDEVVATTTATGSAPDYAFSDVAPGTYTIKMSATGSLGFVINNVDVTAGENTAIPSDTVTLIFGNYDGDDEITSFDVMEIIPHANNFTYNEAADFDGSRDIDIMDAANTIPFMNANTNAADQVLDLLA